MNRCCCRLCRRLAIITATAHTHIAICSRCSPRYLRRYCCSRCCSRRYLASLLLLTSLTLTLTLTLRTHCRYCCSAAHTDIAHIDTVAHTAAYTHVDTRRYCYCRVARLLADARRFHCCCSLMLFAIACSRCSRCSRRYLASLLLLTSLTLTSLLLLGCSSQLLLLSCHTAARRHAAAR